MNLELIRKHFTPTSTIGELFIDGKFFCHTLEDVDRGLTHADPSRNSLKVKGKTAIPTGMYIVSNTFSPRFKKYLPLLLNVPAFAGIRIHPGNTAEHTDGCILVGKYTEKNKITSSKTTFESLHAILKKAEKTQKITINITREKDDSFYNFPNAVSL